MRAYQTPEEAARGDVPGRYGRAAAVSRSSDGQHALVLLVTNEEPATYPCVVACRHEGDGWVEGIGGSAGGGWIATDSDAGLGVAHCEEEAPPSARAARVRFRDREEVVPVQRGFVLFAAWDVPVEASDQLARVVDWI